MSRGKSLSRVGFPAQNAWSFPVPVIPGPRLTDVVTFDVSRSNIAIFDIDTAGGRPKASSHI